MCCGEWGTLQTNITVMCRECSQCLGHTGFALAHGVCAFAVYTAQAPGFSAGELRRALGGVHFPGISHSGSGSWVLHKGGGSVGPVFSAFPRSKQLRWPGVCQAHILQVGRCILSPPPVPAAQVCPLFLSAGAASQVCPLFPLGSWSLAVTLLVDINHPGSQEDLVSNWEPAWSLIEDAISWAKFAPCLPALAVTSLPPCLQLGMGWSTAGLLSSGILSVPCSVSSLAVP